jgi:protein disulfide-isomerase-like protein
MKKFALAMLLCSTTYCAEIVNGVLQITGENFDEELKKNSKFIVSFKADWCGSCKDFKPIYETAAVELGKGDPPVALGEVDIEKNEKLAD